MKVFQCVLFAFLIICAISVSFSKNLLNSIIIFMSYSLIMSIIWILLESPDLAITEAAVGAGVTTVLFLVTLKKINAIIKKEETEGEKSDEQKSMKKPDAIVELDDESMKKPDAIVELDDESMNKPDAIVELDDESMKKPDAIVELDDESMKEEKEGDEE